MKFNSEHWVNRKLGVFSSNLKDIIIAKDSNFSKDRPKNVINWHNHKANTYSNEQSNDDGDPIFASSVSYWVSKLNNEIKMRNEIFKDNTKLIDTNELLKENEITSKLYETAQQIFQKYLGNEYQGSLTSDLKAINSADTRVLVLSLRDKFVRFPFDVNSVSQESNIYTIKYTQDFNYFGSTEKDGISDLRTTYDDLEFLVNFLTTENAKKESGKINVGIMTNSGDINWLKSFKVKNIQTDSNDTEDSVSILKEKPENFKNSDIQGQNFEYVKDEYKDIHLKLKDTIKNTDITTEEKYKENPNWSFKVRKVNITLTLELDENTQKFLSTKTLNAVITAQHINDFKNFTNKLTSSCICNCNYCTCDCNYCTCDCNYCTCNCNYCTCDCNYCTCNCNYKANSVDSQDRMQVFTSWPTSSIQTLCSCDANKQQWWTEYYGIATNCPTNTSYVRDSYGIVSFQTSTIPSTVCACNSNYRSSNVPTSLFNSDFNSSSTPFNGLTSSSEYTAVPTFSNAETKGSGTHETIVENSKKYTVTTEVSKICTCDVNKNVTTQSVSIRYDNFLWAYDTSNRNLDGTLERRYRFKTIAELTNRPSSVYFSNDWRAWSKPGILSGSYSSIQDFVNKTGTFPQVYFSSNYGKITCPSNREYGTKVNFKQFWEFTNSKKGPETK